jgi:hypothetical protein
VKQRGHIAYSGSDRPETLDSLAERLRISNA